MPFDWSVFEPHTIPDPQTILPPVENCRLTAPVFVS